MDTGSAEIALDTYKKIIRRKFMEAGDTVFGPGFISMVEYYFMIKTGYSPFTMLFSEPRIVYDEWIHTFKGEEPIRRLFEEAVGPSFVTLLESVKRNDEIAVWNALYSKTFAVKDNHNIVGGPAGGGCAGAPAATV